MQNIGTRRGPGSVSLTGRRVVAHRRHTSPVGSRRRRRRRCIPVTAATLATPTGTLPRISPSFSIYTSTLPHLEGRSLRRRAPTQAQIDVCYIARGPPVVGCCAPLLLPAADGEASRFCRASAFPAISLSRSLVIIPPFFLSNPVDPRSFAAIRASSLLSSLRFFRDTW